MASPRTDDSNAKLKALRERTGDTFLNCRKALEATGWDEEKAYQLIRSRLWNEMPKLINPVRK